MSPPAPTSAAVRRTLFVGIDTGGTYTDAVVYDPDHRVVMGTAKAPTTHDDLAEGIAGALDAALVAASVDPARVAMVALSTTLATNALVEGRGRPAALVMIGFGADAVDRGGLRAALGDDPVLRVTGGHSPHGEELAPLDLAALARGVDEVDDAVDAYAVTARFGVRNADHEQAARELIRSRTGKPVTCSHELVDALNGPLRSVTALLNARLIALVDELVATVTATMADRGIGAPLMVVRGNGSLVSARVVRERPVETILSGPAASLVGAAHLAGLDDAIIADIGGTTTDIAVLREGLPELGAEGTTVGGHHTMVEAVLMHTHGLGGDSIVEPDDRAHGCRLRIGPRRVVPLVQAAADDAAVLTHLARRLDAATAPGEWTGRFLQRTAKIGDSSGLRREAGVLDRLGEGWTPADAVVRGAVDSRAVARLVSLGLLRMAAFTPTDASHVLGTQTTHHPEAGRLGAALLARRLDAAGRPIADSAESAAEATSSTLVRRSVEAVLAAALERDGLPAEAARSEVVGAAIDASPRTVRLVAGVQVPVVGLGAPACTYYPDVARRLGAEVVIPDHAAVANAVGAAVGRVRARRQVTVTSPRRGTFRVHAGDDPITVHDLESARALATRRASESVVAEMQAAGAAEEQLDVRWHETMVEVEGRPMFVEGVATVSAAGPPRLD